MSPGAVSSEGLSREGGAASEMAHCWQEALLPYHMKLSTGCLSVLMKWQLASPGASSLSEGKEDITVTVSEVAYSLVLCMLSVRSGSFSSRSRGGEQAQPLKRRSVENKGTYFKTPAGGTRAPMPPVCFHGQVSP